MGNPNYGLNMKMKNGLKLLLGFLGPNTKIKHLLILVFYFFLFLMEFSFEPPLRLNLWFSLCAMPMFI